MISPAKRRAKFFLAAIVLSAIACASACKGGGANSAKTAPPPVQTAPPSPLVIATQSPLPRADSGRPYNFALQVTGGTPPYNWSIPPDDLPLPNGLKLSSSGVINGTPGDLSAIHSLFTFQVKDSAGDTATRNLELQCVAPLKFGSAEPLLDGNVGIPYSFNVPASGGVQPYTFGLASGSAPLPPGLVLSNQNGIGVVQGTLAKPGTFPFELQVLDSGTPQLQATQSYTLHVLKNVVIPISSLPAGVQSVPYSESLKVVGGTPPYHWEIAGQISELPDDLTLDPSTGIVSGTPTNPGSSTFQVQVTDSASPPSSKSQSIQLTINGPLAVQSFSLPDAARGSSYRASISVVGGRPPYLARLARGALPAGLFIASSNGSIVVSGTPVIDGEFSSTIRISDSYETPNIVTHDARIRISEPLAISQTDFLNSIKEGQRIDAAFSATGGIPPYTWTMNNIPPGLTFDTATGALTGIATGVSKFTAVVTVRDSSNPPLSASATFSLQITALLRIPPSVWPAITSATNAWLAPPVIRDGVAPASSAPTTEQRIVSPNRAMKDGREDHSHLSGKARLASVRFTGEL
jgi:hypothetical protein